MANEPFTGVVDIHHHDGAWSPEKVRAGGVRALIHKATEGVGWSDPACMEAIRAALSVDLAVGVYHFGTGSTTGEVQAHELLRFVDTLPVRPPALLVALDWESNPNAHRFGHMSQFQAFDFVKTLRHELGRFPVLYSGTHFLGKNLTNDSCADYLAQCPLWQAQYGERPARLPGRWRSRLFWQYTNGSAGPANTARYPRRTVGFVRPLQDRSAFVGSEHELRAAWGTVGVPIP